MSVLKNKILTWIGIMATVAGLSLVIFNFSDINSHPLILRSSAEDIQEVDAVIGQSEITVAENENSSSENNVEPNETVANDDERQGPERLVIDKIGVNAYIQHVGIGKSGNMAVPSNFKDVGWYKYGPEPGERGNAVMDGHLDNALGLPGVFKNLSKLEAGDVIKTVDSDGTSHSFKVSYKKIYNYQATNLDEIFGEYNGSRLVLITCGGNWLSSERSYDERVVIFADLI